MIKIVCNRCGEDIDMDQYPGYIAWNFRDRDNGNMTDPNIFENCDYCEECMEKIKEFITHGPAQAPTEPVNITATAANPAESTHPAADQIPDDKAGERNSQIDMDKVNALRNAGWNIGKIAEEMALTPEEIAFKVYEYRKQKKNP